MPPISLTRPFAATALTLLMASTATLVLTGCGDNTSGNHTPSTSVPRPVLVVSAVAGSATGPEFIGEVRARQRAELAFAVQGLVQQVLVESGDKVRRGQLLATVESAPSQAQLGVSHADWQRLLAAFDEARRKQQRVLSAYERQAASEAEWTAAQADLRMAEAALAAAQAQRDGSAWSRARAELRAPFDGVIASRSLEVGQVVGPGMQVLTVDGAGRELWTSLPVGLKPLRVGESVRLQTPRGEQDSKLLRIGARVEAGGTQRAAFALQDDWRVGDTLSVRLLDRASEGGTVLVPLRAVQGSGISNGAAERSAQVFRIKAEGDTVERVSVRLGTLQDDQVEVLQGLAPGDRLVVAGGHALAPSERVKPVSSLR